MLRRIPWTPFANDLAQATDADLAVLKDIPEGWHIDYKEEVNADPRKIAKHLAAFANAHGGYLIFGARETKDGSRRAESFPGISASDYAAAEQAIRAAATAHLSTPVSFACHRIASSGNSPHIPVGNVVMIVAIPPSDDTPVIHSDGVIYRRVADSSDPRPETDRAVLDLLWARRSAMEDRVRRFVDDLPEMSDEEQTLPYLHYHLVPDPRSPSPSTDADWQDLQRLLQSAGDSGLPFDSFHPCAGGFVARQARGNPFSRIPLTWRGFTDGRQTITLPISWFKLRNWREYARQKKYRDEDFEPFFQCAIDQSIEQNHLFFDITDIFDITSGLSAKLKALEAIHRPAPHWFGCVTLSGAWRRSPCLAGAGYAAHVATSGIPLIQNRTARSPDGWSAGQLVDLNPPETPDAPRLRPLIRLFVESLHLFGIPPTMLEHIEEWSDIAREAHARRLQPGLVPGATDKGS